MNRLQEKHAQKFGEPTIKGNWHFLENWGPSELQKLMDSDFSIEDMILESLEVFDVWSWGTAQT